jgi:hypothetical protein
MSIQKFRAWDGKKFHYFNALDGLHDIATRADWIQQFSGRKDKGGADIYEGDILIDDCGNFTCVRFGKLPLDKTGDCFFTYDAFYCECAGKIGSSPMYACQEIGDWIKVVSHIFDESCAAHGPAAHFLKGKE